MSKPACARACACVCVCAFDESARGVLINKNN